MPELSDENKKIFDRLAEEYNRLPSYKKWFYPRGLRVAIGKYEADQSLTSAFDVCTAYINTIRLFQPWIFSSLHSFSGSRIVHAVIGLNQDGLLIGEAGRDNFNVVAGHNDPYDVSFTLYLFNTAGLLTGDTGRVIRGAVAGHQDPESLANAIIILLKVRTLSIGMARKVNFNAVIGHQCPRSLHRALYSLYHAGLLTGEAGQWVFDLVVNTYSAILIQPETELIWYSIRFRNPNTSSIQRIQEHFESIIGICDTHRNNVPEARRLFIAYSNQNILGVNAPQGLHANQSDRVAASLSQNRFFSARSCDDPIENDVFWPEADSP